MSEPCAAFCECCEPRTAPAPAMIFNRPGLAQIEWRPGSYATFRQAMIEALAAGPRKPSDLDDPQWPGETRAALASLTTRDNADYSIMLIDMFAAVSDVLGFYSERFANEMFLRTAKERDSLLRMVRLIGYRLAPGLASTTALAFTLDPGAKVHLRSGLKVMSVPGQDERPQTFETIAAIEADARLNDLPLFGAPQPLVPFGQGQSRIPLRMRPDPLLRGDTLAIVSGNTLELTNILGLDVLPDGEYLRLARAIGIAGPGAVGLKLLRQLNFFGHTLPDSFPFYDANPALAPALRWKTKVAGTDYKINLAPNRPRYALDRKVDDLKPGALLLADLGSGASPRFVFATVRTVESDTAHTGPLTDTVSWVALQPVGIAPGAAAPVPQPGTGLPAIMDLRATRLFELAPQPIVPRPYRYPAALSGNTAYVRSEHLDAPDLLKKKQRILISEGPHRHVAVVGSVSMIPAGVDGIAHTAIGFSPAIGAGMKEPRLNGNVSPASHGETQMDETLGHGDSGKSFQRFRLQRKVLTRLPGTTGIAPRAEIAVRVNGELWEEVPSLFGQAPAARVYTLRDDDEGFSTVGFGDGKTGARLPSGAANIVARYRTGLGAAGRVRSDQLATLLERPVGLRGVSNPLAADGGADPETLADARHLAPATVRTFGRAISLQDFEDVARQTGLVARARATWAWIGIERAIQLTVAGDDGARLSADAMKILFEALGTARDPNHPLILGNLWRVPVVVEARIMRDPRYEADAVAESAREALTAFLAFSNQPLGHALHLSQIVSALQSGRGVVAVDIDRFQVKGSAGWTSAQRARRGATAAPVQEHVRLFDARPRPAASALDPLALAGLALDPDILALPAEQAFAQAPAIDLLLTMVDQL